MFVVRNTWPDGDVVYRVADGDGSRGTRDLTEATRFTREAAESLAEGLRGGSPEFVGTCVDVVPA